MAGLRETVGVAYVRILADGKDLPKSIRDELDKNDKAFEEAGDRQAQKYGDSFKKRLDSNKDIEGALDKRLRESEPQIAADAEFLADGFSDRWAKRFEKSITNLFPEFEKDAGELGKRMGDSLAKDFALHDTVDVSFVDRFRRALADLAKTERARDAEAAAEDKRRKKSILDQVNGIHQVERLVAAAGAAAEAIELKRRKGIADQLAAALKVERLIIAANKAEEAARDKTMSVTKKGLDALITDYSALAKKVEGYANGTRRAGVDSKELRAEVEKLRGRFKETEALTGAVARRFEEMARTTRTLGDRLIHVGEGMGGLGDKVGKVFGKGARNNFVNAVGIIVGGIASIPTAMLEMAGKVVNIFDGLGKVFSGFFDAFNQAWGQGQKGMSGFFDALGQGSSEAMAMFKELAGLGPIAIGAIAAAVVAALPLLTVFVGAVVSALSSMVGVIVALAGSISFGLLGAVAALAPLLVPLAASIGVLGLAFTGLDKKAKAALATSIKPLKKELTNLRTEAQKGLFGDNIAKGAKTLSDELLPAMQALEPLVHNVAAAIRSVFDSFAKGAADPKGGFQTFVKFWSVHAPPMIKSFGAIFQNVLGGIGNILMGNAGHAQDFLAWVQKLSVEFKNWTKSKKAKDFFNGAVQSAKDLWGLVKQVGRVIGELLGGGKKTGDNIITSLTDNVKKFADYLSTPKGKKALADWFKQAETIAGQIGDVVVEIGKLIAVLDSPAAKKAASIIFDSIKGAIIITSFFVRLFMSLLSEMGREFKILANDAKWVGSHIKSAFEALIALPGEIQAAFATLGGIIIAGFRTAWTYITGTFLPRFASIPIRVIHFLGSLASGVYHAIIKGFQSAVTWVTGTFIPWAGRIAGRVISALGGLWSGVRTAITHGFQAAVTWVETTLIPYFRRLPARIIAALGDIGSAISHAITDHLPKHISIAGHQIFDAGGVVFGPTAAMLSADGQPEAVVPLNKSLSQVDPAVRSLSAFAQGKLQPAATVVQGRSVNVGGITIITPTEDPRAVASETINKLVAKTYL